MKELERRFHPVNLDQAHSNRSEFLLYLDYLRVMNDVSKALRLLSSYSAAGLLPALSALASQHVARKEGDFTLAATLLGELAERSPHDGYITSLYLESLVADARPELVHPTIQRFVPGFEHLSEDQMLRIALIAAIAGDWDSCERVRRVALRMSACSPVKWASVSKRLEYARNFRGHTLEVPVSIINLQKDRRKFRLSNALYSMFDIDPLRVEAVIGSDLTSLVAKSVLSPSGSILGRGAIGCALSHVQAWEKIASGRDDFHLVIEDDGLPYSWQDLGRLVTEAGNFDVLFVNERMSSLMTKELHTGYSSLWDTLATRPDHMRGWGGDGYILSRRGAEKLVGAVIEDRVVGHIDGQLGSYGINSSQHPITSQAPLSRAQRVGLACRKNLRSEVVLEVKSLQFPLVASYNFGYSSIVSSGGHQ
ncbi:glycosyltransferase family 25 protein [Arthrobacter sp. CAN_A6]|uniref:glycosyltransferase family 25 protein n=1 Tax=Arthrobacter sp. CAN_A6 TaxID=2787721 RepID=UPI0018CBF13E